MRQFLKDVGPDTIVKDFAIYFSELPICYFFFDFLGYIFMFCSS